jgi:hypothetical protein
MDTLNLKEFIENLENRGPLVIGRYEIMKKLPDGVIMAPKTNLTRKASHPEVPDSQVSVGTNPYLLMVRDQKSGLQGQGTNNCCTCQHFKPNQKCPETGAMLNQAAVTNYGGGGCAMQKLISVLSDSQGYPNRFYELIVETVLEQNKVAVLSGVDVKYLDIEELRITI